LDPPKPPTPAVPAVLYLRQHLRSGQTVSHKGHLVIIGDVNPGAEVMAEGDVTVWGALRGIAHAGIGGNVDAEIRALKLQPIQIRIAHAIARSPDKPRYKFSRFADCGPETAKIIDGKIKIAKSSVD
jgi:septum site-determining protein MinC